MHFKDFDTWSEEKKRLDRVKPRDQYFPHEQWVWMLSLGVNIGFEQDGIGESFSRPAVVVKKFNNQMYWVVPLTSKQKNLDFYYNYTDAEGNNVAAIASQLRLVSTKRFQREMYKMDSRNFENLRDLLKSFI